VAAVPMTPDDHTFAVLLSCPMLLLATMT